MSIMAIIQEPETDFEKAFSIPISTERFFEDTWLPLADELELQWIPIFQTGIDIAKEDLGDVLNELDRLTALATQKLSEKTLSDLIPRLELIVEELPKAFEREDALVFIG